jgi:site-specific DNA-cytosine methylase
MRAIGCHVFAGGMTKGMREAGLLVDEQLEVHGLGQHTVEEKLGLQFTCPANGAAWWPARKANLVYGNPRCTGFSTLTGGAGETARGPCARQTRDIWELCEYSASMRPLPEFVVFESVQGAMGVGRPLLDMLRDELFLPNGYAITHVLLSSATHGCSQRRRRYYHVAHRIPFLVSLPEAQIAPTLGDAVGRIDARLGNTNRELRLVDTRFADYGPDDRNKMSEEDLKVLPHLAQGQSLNRFAQNDDGAMLETLSEKLYFRWLTRNSGRPFGLHCMARPRPWKPCPTLTSSHSRMVHPYVDRTVTVREFAHLMQWGELLPLGPLPFAQMAKGVCPPVARWIGEQLVRSLNGRPDGHGHDGTITVAWRDDDGETRVETRRLSGSESVVDFTDLVNWSKTHEDHELQHDGSSVDGDAASAAV